MAACDAIVFGGYGTFGAHVVRELIGAGLRVTIAGRNRHRAERAASSYGGPNRGIAASVSDAAGCRAAVNGHRVAINAAGPFSTLGESLLDACLATRCHYVDITDDRNYAAIVRGRSAEFATAGLTAAYGCSSLPGISGAIAHVLCAEAELAVDHLRVTLFIGNRNPKGRGAVESAAASIGLPIAAPQGTLIGFGDSERVSLYAPFGCRRVLNFNSPDYEILPAALDLKSLVVKVGFELAGVTTSFRLASRYAPFAGRWLIPRLVPWSRLLSFVGSSGGQVMVESFADGRAVGRGAVIAHADGQRLAALPAVFVATRLVKARPPAGGAATAYQVLGSQPLLGLLEAAGYELKLEPRPAAVP